MTERCRLCSNDFTNVDDPPICSACTDVVLGAVRLVIQSDRLGDALAGLFNRSPVAAIARVEAANARLERERDQARAEVQRVVETSTAQIAKLRNQVAALEAAHDELVRERDATVRAISGLRERMARALDCYSPSIDGVDLAAVAKNMREENERLRAALANEADARGVLTGEVAAIRGDLKRARDRLHEAERANEAELVEALRVDVASWRERATRAEAEVAALRAQAGLLRGLLGDDDPVGAVDRLHKDWRAAVVRANAAEAEIGAVTRCLGLDRIGEAEPMPLSSHVERVIASLRAEVQTASMKRITADDELIDALRADVSSWRKRADDAEAEIKAVRTAAGLDAIGAPDTAFWSPFGTVRACRHCGVLIAGGRTACIGCEPPGVKP